MKENEFRLGRGFGRLTAIAAAALSMLMLLPQVAVAAPLSGAIFTTDSGCTGVNINIFASKDDVYLNGGPTHPGAASLPDGSYYVQVTDPSGATVLGTSVGDAVAQPFVVANNGTSITCAQLVDLVGGYDDTPNAGGEYKVWVSTDPSFTSSDTKTDNFKVKAPTCSSEPCTPHEPQARLRVLKFYDANANGVNDDSQLINGWQVRIQDGFDIIRYTPVDIVVAPDTYTVTESQPVELNWLRTTPNPVNVTLADGDDQTVTFGNLCLGAGGGLTLGFWSNKNGQVIFNSSPTNLALMNSLNLRNANGTDFNPPDYATFRSWLLSATATNMAYMLSAQLAAMELNVNNGKVSGSALIYAPGATSANSLGFATVNQVMAEADASLGANGYTVDAGAVRTYQEALKNALDRANNNLNFVQGTPCLFSFAS